MTINSVIPLKIITTNVMINCFFLSKERCLKRLNIGCIELFIKYFDGLPNKTKAYLLDNSTEETEATDPAIRTNKDTKLLFPISNMLPFINVILLSFYAHYCF